MMKNDACSEVFDFKKPKHQPVVLGEDVISNLRFGLMMLAFSLLIVGCLIAYTTVELHSKAVIAQQRFVDKVKLDHPEIARQVENNISSNQ